MPRIKANPTTETTRATPCPDVRLARESRKPRVAARPMIAVVLRMPGTMVESAGSWLRPFVTAAGSIQKATSANTSPRTSTGTIRPGRNRIQPSVRRTTKASPRASASRRMTPAANSKAVSTTAATCTSQNQPYPRRAEIGVVVSRVAVLTGCIVALRKTVRSAEDHGHVVEVGEVGFEERLADPVLAGVENVVDADLGGGDAGQGYRVLGIGIANRGAVPRSPGPQRYAREAGLDPHLHRIAGRQRGVDRGRRESF